MDELTRAEPSRGLAPTDSDHTVFQAAKGAGIVWAGALFGYGSQFLIGILLTRLLGAEQFGQYKVAVSTAEIAAAFALLGMDYALVRFVSLYASRRDMARLWGTLQVGVGLTTLSSLVIGVGLFALATPIALHLFHEPRLVPLLHLASLIVPFLILSHALSCATRGFNKMQYATVAEQIAQPLTRLILIVPLALLGFTAGRAIGVYIAGLIVTCALLLFFLDRLFPLTQPTQTARRDTKGLLLFSIPAYFSTLLDTFGSRLQIILLGSLSTIAAAGIFSVAAQVSMLSSMFNQSIGTASSPIISELHGQGAREQMAHFYRTTTKWMFTVNLPIFLLILVLSKPILAIFGNEFLEGYEALIILSTANLVTAAAGISDGILAMTGNTSVKLLNSAVLTAFTLGLCFLLIPRWGEAGAALTALVTATAINLLRVLEVSVLFRMLPFNLGFLKPAAAGLVALAIGWLMRQLLHTETHLALAAMNALVILLAYVSMILLLGLSPEEHAMFAHFRSRVASPFSRRGLSKSAR
jgi:O-antigen/teichoic acid export membrane protein